MPRARRLAPVRTCLLIAGVALLSATSALAMRTHRSHGPSASRLHDTSHAVLASESRVSGRKSSSSRRARCVAAAHRRRRRQADRSCAVRKRRVAGARQTVSAKRSGADAPATPVEPVPPVELRAPIGPAPPIEKPTPPVEEPPKQPTEETKPPVEESKPPVEEKIKEEKAREEKLQEEQAAEEQAAEERAKEAKAKEEKAREEQRLAEEEAREEKAKEEKVREESQPSAEEPTAPFRFFSPTSFWNESLSANAPLDPNSAAVVGAFDEEIAAVEEAKKGSASINTTAWSVPIYTVPADEPAVEVTLVRASRAPTLQAAWDAVPLPADAQPAAGTDKHLVVWQPSTERLWEFWGLEKTEEGWQASWGGAIQNVSSDSGAYGPEAWPGARIGWGASASSLSITGGLITLEDLERGQINHALAMAIPHPRAGVYASPAERSDGWSTEPLSLPEGAHLRLDPNLDLASLHLPRVTLMMAVAAQRYGIVVRDTAANVAFYAQDPTPTGTNPYTGPHGYFEGRSPQQLLAAFPWSHLQLLKMELHSAS